MNEKGHFLERTLDSFEDETIVRVWQAQHNQLWYAVLDTGPRGYEQDPKFWASASNRDSAVRKCAKKIRDNARGDSEIPTHSIFTEEYDFRYRLCMWWDFKERHPEVFAHELDQTMPYGSSIISGHLNRILEQLNGINPSTTFRIIRWGPEIRFESSIPLYYNNQHGLIDPYELRIGRWDHLRMLLDYVREDTQDMPGWTVESYVLARMLINQGIEFWTELSDGFRCTFDQYYPPLEQAA